MELKADYDGALVFEAKADGYIFFKPQHCVEISAEEFNSLIHAALEQALKPKDAKK